MVYITAYIQNNNKIATARPTSTAARLNNVAATNLCTTLAINGQDNIAMVEHILAALRGMGVDNAVIDVNGPELPMLDGSAIDYAKSIAVAGVKQLNESRSYIKITRPVRIEHNGSYAEFIPYDGSRFEVYIDFTNKVIGQQSMSVDLDADTFYHQIAAARTFGFLADVQQLWRNGLALGSSLANAIVIDGDRVLNHEGLRFDNEFARHKLLDAIGDLALAGYPIIGHYKSYCGGHKLNYLALRELFATTDAWCLVKSGQLFNSTKSIREPADNYDFSQAV